MTQARQPEQKPAPRANVDIQKRDAETYIALGLFILVVGLPVVLGTYWAYMPADSVALVVSRGPFAVMPKLVGLEQHEAQSAIEEAGLTVGTITKAYTTGTAAGKISQQAVEAGALLEPETQVDFTVSEGPPFPVRVPNVVHQYQALAIKKLDFAHLRPGAISESFSADVAEGKVISQQPAGDETALSGTPVDLVISKGPAMTIVPDTTGLAHEDAKKTVTAADLLPGPISEAYNATIPKGCVVSQNPAAGCESPVGAPVQFVISLGPSGAITRTVPPVAGKTEEKARQSLEEKGLRVSEAARVFSKSVPPGQVIRQTPVGGAYLEPHFRAAAVNLACAIVLLLIGIASIAYGKVLMGRYKRRL